MDTQTISSESSQSGKSWRDHSLTITLALIAAMAPLTTAAYTYFDGKSELALAESKQKAELALAESKQRSALRQQYLDYYMNQKLPNAEREKILQFLVDVDEDSQLKVWAAKRLAETQKAISKSDLYNDMIRTVSALATADISPGTTIDPKSRNYERFWELYRRDLLNVESAQVESLMVTIGRELEGLKGRPPSEELKGLSYTLARTAKAELELDVR